MFLIPRVRWQAKFIKCKFKIQIWNIVKDYVQYYIIKKKILLNHKVMKMLKSNLQNVDTFFSLSLAANKNINV